MQKNIYETIDENIYENVVYTNVIKNKMYLQDVSLRKMYLQDVSYKCRFSQEAR